MTAERIAEIKERLEGADSAPWDISVVDNGLRIDALGDGYGPDGADAWFLAHVREDITDLLAEVERLRDLARIALKGGGGS